MLLVERYIGPTTTEISMEVPRKSKSRTPLDTIHGCLLKGLQVNIPGIAHTYLFQYYL